MRPLRGPVILTGTDTAVGKTIVTAAMAAAATQAGLRVAVVKPGQTGTAEEEETDAETVQRLAGPATVRTLASYPDPLAPLTAARVSGLAPLVLADVLSAVEDLAADHELVLVEGAGGLFVQLGDGGWTVADLAITLGAPAVVVARPGLGTLNHTALTLEALDRRGVPARVVVGSWPDQPELVHRTNLTDLTGELAGVVPDGVGGWQPAPFREQAAYWLAPELHGTFDAEKFRGAVASL
ncbi:ATP-dependent dethiobiotin synthetase BioD [Planosporangium flavigriseum]|uniref:ATP-dependent dethiobiotin synthetase BioD n=1 Tax=Planosporangium flavigriseum TaxID=373681 RepID=A0A8J3LKR7_9ACTN|nr:dethiobiotin synthase [Planosporangium flavigriseum]NJC63161.1 ATP-dependent dethiobiotin synthetase BioD [Planosporangium flavigriseum]GIG72433.1 ATP-dependent dethiobiotin synthetase BioD [Planosporangium flavigriseum]